jgi:signal peptidase II
MNKNLQNGSITAVICLIIDQLHKFYMLEIYQIDKKSFVEVTDFFNLVMVWNRGISFGMFHGAENSNYFFMVFTSLIVILLFYFIKKSESKLEAISFGMIIGGALGNLTDRILRGAVADFFDFHIAENHWPAFNIADSCVFCGAALLIITTIFFGNKNKTKTESENEK